MLREDVALMRELGVVEWNGIKLGPPPPPNVEPPAPLTQEQAEEVKRAAKRSRLRLMLAASGVKFSDAQLDEMAEP